MKVRIVRSQSLHANREICSSNLGSNKAFFCLFVCFAPFLKFISFVLLTNSKQNVLDQKYGLYTSDMRWECSPSLHLSVIEYKYRWYSGISRGRGRTYSIKYKGIMSIYVWLQILKTCRQKPRNPIRYVRKAVAEQIQLSERDPSLNK